MEGKYPLQSTSFQSLTTSQEGQERKINLPDDDFDVIAAYIKWASSGNIEPVPTAPPTPVTGDEVLAANLLLAKLYIFGHKITYDQLCNDTISAWTVFLQRKREDGRPVAVPGGLALQVIYKGTPIGSPLRRFVVHLYAKGKKSWFILGQHDRSPPPPEFLIELVHELLPELGPSRGDLTGLANTWFK